MVEKTPNHDLNKYQIGDSSWTHAPDMETIEERLVIRDREGNRTSYVAYEGALFIATDTGAVFDSDGENWIRASRSYGAVRADQFIKKTTESRLEGHIVEAFESGDLAHYSGDTDVWTVGTSDIIGGNMLQFNNASGDMKIIWTDSVETRRGERYTTYVRLGADTSNSPVMVVCGQVSNGTIDAGYGIGLAANGNNARLIKEPTDTDELWFVNTLDTDDMTVSGGVLYRMEIDLEAGGAIRGRIINVDTGQVEATLRATDTEFQNGVFGYRNATSKGNAADFDFATRGVLQTTESSIHTPDIDRLFVRDTDPANEYNDITDRDFWIDTS